MGSQCVCPGWPRICEQHRTESHVSHHHRGLGLSTQVNVDTQLLGGSEGPEQALDKIVKDHVDITLISGQEYMI